MESYDAFRNEINDELQSISEDVPRKAQNNGTLAGNVETEYNCQQREHLTLLRDIQQQQQQYNCQQREHLTLLREIQQQQQQYKAQVDKVLFEMSQIQEALKPPLPRKACHLSPLPPPTPSRHEPGASSTWKPE